MTTRKVLHIGAAGIAIIFGGCIAQAGTKQTKVETGLLPAVSFAGEPVRRMTIEERMAHHHVPGVSIAVVDGNRLVWARAFGVARPGQGVTTNTLFQAGSLSKPITAAAALTLAQRRKLELDGPINSHLTSWKVPDSEFGQGNLVTLRSILGHTSGLGPHGFRGYGAAEAVPSLRQILEGQAPANSEAIRIREAPGSAMRYSGGGYVVLQQAIEDVGKAPFSSSLQKLILRPLGMKSSLFAQPLPEQLRSRAAVGYVGPGRELPGGWHTLPELAAAGLWSNPSDLSRFLIWLNEGAGSSKKGSHSAVIRQMMEPQKDSTGQRFITPKGSHAGLGLVLEGDEPSMRFSHAGSNVGQRAMMIGFPGTGQGAVVMANSDSSPALIQEIVRSIAAAYGWPERFHRVVPPLQLEPGQLERLAGTYSFESRQAPGKPMRIAVSARPNALHAVLPDGTSHDLRPVSSSEFIDPSTEMTIFIGPDGTLRLPAYRITATRDEAAK